MLAPISILMPAAIEKNAVAEEMSRMRGRGLEHITTSAGPRKGKEIPLYKAGRILKHQLGKLF
jgi:hypothetical protein